MTAHGVTVIALADGAGSAPLSHEGAEIAVQTICKTLCGQFDELYASASPMEMRLKALREVRQNISSHAAERNMDTSCFACTLLAVAPAEMSIFWYTLGTALLPTRKMENCW